jgi:hypothetical protein
MTRAQCASVLSIPILALLAASCSGGDGDSSSPTSPSAAAAGCSGSAVPQVRVGFQSFDGLGLRVVMYGETFDHPTLTESLVVTRALTPCDYEIVGQMLGRSLSVNFGRTTPFTNREQGVERGSVVIVEGPGTFSSSAEGCAVRFQSQATANGQGPPGPFNIRIKFRVANTNGVDSTGGCGEAAVSAAPPATPPPTPSPTTPAPTTPAPTLNLAGTWTGTFRAATRPTETHPIISWTLAQSGANVSGPAVFGDGGGSGTVAGGVSGAQLTSIVLNVVITDLPGCSYTGTGTLAATASSMSGTLAMTFTAPCVGPDLASVSATDTWTVALAK